MSTIRGAKADKIEAYVEFARAEVAELAESAATVASLRAFRDAYAELQALDADAISAESTALGAWYLDELVPALSDTRGEPVAPLELVSGGNPAAVYLQSKYIAESPLELSEKRLLSDAQDGSAWTEVHRELHPDLRENADRFEFADLYLIEPETNTVVYSTEKGIDFATSLDTGPHSGTSLARLTRQILADPEPNRVYVADFSSYAPALDQPSMFLASPVFDGDELVGLVAARLPTNGVDNLMTRDWQEGRFGDTGEAYLVGEDNRMRSAFAPDNSELDDANDGSAYSVAHARHHPVLRALSDATNLGDLILVDAATSSVVYTVDKRVDFGTNLATGPYADSNLATVVLDQLTAAAAGEAVVVDFASYLPAGAAPTLFVAAAIRDEGRVVGAVALEVPNELVVDITTAGGDWEGTGLGKTGEVYIVGRDRLMRSTSRLWLQDPSAYLSTVASAGYGPEVAESVEAFDSTVLIQPVDTDAVSAALRGNLFSEVTRNYLDQETLAVAGELDVTGVDWVIVADVTTEEAYEPLRSYVKRILLIAVILVPLVAFVGIFLAGRLMRPVRPIVAAARRVSGGELDVELPAEGRDEFAELGRRFNGMVEALREQRAELSRTDAETTELLSAVLPSRLVEQVKQGDQEIAEAVRNATLIAVSVELDPDTSAADPDELLNLSVEIQSALRALAESYAVEQFNSSASEQLFATGLRTDELEAERAIEFVSAARESAAAFGETRSVEVAFRAGVAAGDVIAGVIGTERMSFDVWGDPSRLAVALAAVAQPGNVLVDKTVAAAVDRVWQLEQDPGLMGLGGESLAGWYVRGRRGAPHTREAG